MKRPHGRSFLYRVQKGSDTDMKEKKSKNDIRELPLAVLEDMVIFPGNTIQFDVSDKRAVAAAEAAMLSDGYMFVMMSRSEKNTEESFYPLSGKEKGEGFNENIGSVVKITQMIRLDNGMLRLQVYGDGRSVLIEKDPLSAPYDIAKISPVAEDAVTDSIKAEAIRRELINEAEGYASETAGINGMMLRFRKIRNLSALADSIISSLPFNLDDRLEILGTAAVFLRCRKLLSILKNERNIIKNRREIAEKISLQVDEHQKEYLLREQLYFIRNELGENDDDNNSEKSEADLFKEAVEKLDAPEEVKEKLRKEIRHFVYSGFSQEGQVDRAYIETLLELPWNKTSEDHDKKIDINKAKDILERDHYGLKDVKERVIEYLAVRTLTARSDASILCLVGPPGTGKTSIARSVAEATGKPYVRICLGGVRDEAEIRGHRKTYVGAMPGRVTAALKQAGVKDPLILLDEIDKMSQDYHGDVASAMLEVLDPEQNKSFRDHYVELPQDLSEVLFIATANDWDNIPRPLLDRMEVIEIAGYTANEKFHIAKEHLLKKTEEKNGVTPSMFRITDGALKKVIDCYTREAGVRELERMISKLCRKTAVEILSRKGKAKNKGPVRITDSNIEQYLGKIKYPPEKLNGKNEAGVVRGLAWTGVGGTTLMVEVNVMPGKGELTLTGQLGDVMKESAMASLTYVRSIASSYGVADDYFQNHDIHVHLPEGAVPKDGPSAGITMATAILSAVTSKRVDRKLAMTGEISLRGNVMPVGGLKEKILAAKTAGVTTVLLPYENMINVEEIDKEITDGIELIYVKHMDEVILRAFETVSKRTRSKNDNKKSRA